MGLHKLGYRSSAHEAPLKETLAAALVRFSRWRPGRPLVDPFCGSATIPIEAAMIGRNIAPGLGRSFAAEKWTVVPKKVWELARQEARDLGRPEESLDICGYDISSRALDLSRIHVRQAGVADCIKLERRDARKLSMASEYGVVVTNPPYGERLGDRSEARELAGAIGDMVRSHPTWSYYVLSSYDWFEKASGRGASKRRKLYNGKIKCQLYQYFGPRPPKDKMDGVSSKQVVEEHGVERVLEVMAKLPSARLKRADLPASLKKVLFALLNARDETTRTQLRKEAAELLLGQELSVLSALCPEVSAGRDEHVESIEEIHLRLERWRDGLINGDLAFKKVIMTSHAQVDGELLDRLAEKARSERAEDAPPRAARRLFRYLRSLERGLL